MIENAVWSEIRKVLSKPQIVLAELKRQNSRNIDEQEIKRLKTILNGLIERESRLIRLYTLGDFDDDMLQKEKAVIAAERIIFEEQMGKLKSPTLPSVDDLDPKSIKSVCKSVAKWLRRANQQEQTLVLEAMQIEVRATKEEITVSGVLPAEIPLSISELQPMSYKQGNRSSSQSGLSFDTSSVLGVANTASSKNPLVAKSP